MYFFEIATMKKFRYQTVRGEVTTEDLWEMELRNPEGYDLESVAIDISNTLKDRKEDFVVKPLPEHRDYDAIKMTIVKHIIKKKLTLVKRAAMRDTE